MWSFDSDPGDRETTRTARGTGVEMATFGVGSWLARRLVLSLGVLLLVLTLSAVIAPGARAAAYVAHDLGGPSGRCWEFRRRCEQPRRGHRGQRSTRIYLVCFGRNGRARREYGGADKRQRPGPTPIGGPRVPPRAIPLDQGWGIGTNRVGDDKRKPNSGCPRRHRVRGQRRISTARAVLERGGRVSRYGPLPAPQGMNNGGEVVGNASPPPSLDACSTLTRPPTGLSRPVLSPSALCPEVAAARRTA